MYLRLVIIASVIVAALYALIAAQQVIGAPYTIADIPSAACDRCVWDGTGFGPLINNVVVDTVRGTPANGNRICMRDVSGALVGTNNITLACRDSTSIWGDTVTVPFSFVRPVSPAAPVSMRVGP